ncbi:MAG: 3,4-dihydroxy-2-butanone-4-phosphate synthase [Thermoplasmatales archaeon]|jgi:3,4-dihydroxy 2-butanone 4-phosphate synthase|nr:3,4-dihydroxy-2-butanone-4-phosphate synthase [Thermoplasmatales archaeon]
MGIERVLDEIRNGRIVLVYDFDEREKETDMTIASEFLRVEDLRRMRKDAGGLVCTTTPYERAKALGLPFMADIYADDSAKYPLMAAMAPTDIPYDGTKSSFGVTVNHRKTYTGITDADRTLTINEYARIIFQEKDDKSIMEDLGRNFRAPGHVHLLNASERILTTRRGHTELCTALMIMAGVKPSATICEMLGNNGGSETKENTMAYAEREGLAFITGDEVISAWELFRKSKE